MHVWGQATECNDLVVAEQSFEKYVLNWIEPSWWERLKLFKFLHLKLFPNQIWGEASQGQAEPEARRDHL